jgi:hypothetical protein
MGMAKAGDILVMNSSGGGGYGDPRKRPKEMIRRDIEDGKVSLKIRRLLKRPRLKRASGLKSNQVTRLRLIWMW